MSYATSEAAALTLLAGTSGFSTDTVVAADFGLLSRGPDQLLVLTYSDFIQEDIAGQGDRFITWGFLLHLYLRWVDNTSVHAAASVARQAIIDRMNAYYRMNGATNVFRADIMTGSVPNLGEPPGALNNIVVGSVKYYHETFRLEVVEELDFAYAEP